MMKVKCIKTKIRGMDYSDELTVGNVYSVRSVCNQDIWVELNDNLIGIYYPPGHPSSMFIWVSGRNPLKEQCYES